MALRVCGCAVSVSTPPFGISALAGTEVPRCALRRCALRRWLAGTPLTSLQSRTGTSACVRAGCSQRCVLPFSDLNIIVRIRLNPTSRVRVTSRPTPRASSSSVLRASSFFRIGLHAGLLTLLCSLPSPALSPLSGSLLITLPHSLPLNSGVRKRSRIRFTPHVVSSLFSSCPVILRGILRLERRRLTFVSGTKLPPRG